MLRLREIDVQTAAHLFELEAAWRSLADEEADASRFATRWRATVRRWSFDEVNDLIDRHNRWYPAESRLPMDPATGDYALVRGEDYRRAPLDGDWALRRFPADREAARADSAGAAHSSSDRGSSA
jgi:hypothetical protein